MGDRNKELQGSVELRESLPYGVMNEMTKIFGYKSSTWVPRMVAGKEKANPLVIECATRISDAYLDCGFEEELKKILKDYE